MWGRSEERNDPFPSFSRALRASHAPISSFPSLWQTRLSLKQWGKNGMFLLVALIFLCLVKVKKPLQKPCTNNLAQHRIQKDRDQSKYIIENVTVEKTFAGTDQTTWNRVKLRYFDWPIPVFLSNLSINYVYSIFVIFLSCQYLCSLLLCVIKARVI